MASTYGYITIAELEALTAVDYSTFTDKDGNEIYSDTVVEAWITHAEELVISYMRRTYEVGADIPTPVIYVTKEMAKIIANNQLIQDGYLDRPEVRPFLDSEMKDLLDTVFEEEKSTASVYSVASVEDWDWRTAW